MKGKYTVYWVLLIAFLAGVLLVYYMLQKRAPVTGAAPVDLETIRLRMDQVEDSVNGTMAYQLLDMAVAASSNGEFSDENLASLDEATDLACADKMVTDHELLVIANPVSMATRGTPVRTRDDVRLLLSR